MKRFKLAILALIVCLFACAKTSETAQQQENGSAGEFKYSKVLQDRKDKGLDPEINDLTIQCTRAMEAAVEKVGGIKRYNELKQQRIEYMLDYYKDPSDANLNKLVALHKDNNLVYGYYMYDCDSIRQAYIDKRAKLEKSGGLAHDTEILSKIVEAQHEARQKYGKNNVN